MMLWNFKKTRRRMTPISSTEDFYNQMFYSREMINVGVEEIGDDYMEGLGSKRSLIKEELFSF